MNFYNFQFNKMIILTNDATDSFIAFKKERKKETSRAQPWSQKNFSERCNISDFLQVAHIRGSRYWIYYYAFM